MLGFYWPGPSSAGIIASRNIHNAKNSSGVISISQASQSPASRLKALVAATPVLGTVARRIARIPAVKDLRRRLGFQGSSTYWEKRYQQGGTSGSGSIGRLAAFKAEILNDYVERMGVGSVIEFGCGDGEQLALARYPRYVGIDVAEGSIAACRQLFKGDEQQKLLSG